ncbi:MAG: DUF1501 domain-containing protein, partial [Planctomycetota bacterium]|nr:DUF1501 domain-containing protein [Planctomycetota bacterium]
MPYTRRQFLDGTLSAGTAGLALPELLRLRAASADSPQEIDSDTAVIQIWLGGGHSQFETFDPKPEAPVEYRGPYGVIPTKHAGISFCEKLPRTAQVIDQAALIRSITHTTNGHYVAAHWLSTGYPGNITPPTHPSSGSIVSHFRGANDPGLPPYVLLSHEQTRNPEIGAVMGTGYLGVQHAPFTVMQDPYRDEFKRRKVVEATSNLTLADNLTIDRVDDRRSLLQQLDRFSRNADASRQMEGIDRFTVAALDMVTSGRARAAFDLTREPEHVRQMYGPHRWGQMALLARRLVESGVTFVTINTAPDSLCWDWHLNIVDDKRPADGSNGPSRGMEHHGPPLDQMVSALL